MIKILKRNILITGATGLVGSYLTKYFLSKGCKVFCCARHLDGISAEKRVSDVLFFWNDDLFNSNNLVVFDKLHPQNKSVATS